MYLFDDWFRDGGGKDFILQLRTLDPGTPIVFLSGDARAANQEEIIRLGAQAFLAKPVDLQEVVATIAQGLCTTEQEQAVFQIDSAKFPTMITAGELYECLLGVTRPEDSNFASATNAPAGLV